MKYCNIVDFCTYNIKVGNYGETLNHYHIARGFGSTRQLSLLPLSYRATQGQQAIL